MQEFFKTKKAGFYVSAAAAVLSLVTAIIYAGYYGHGPREAHIDCMSWWAFALLLIAVAGAVALTLLKQNAWVPVCLAVCSVASLMFYIYGVYPYVSVVMTGIDLKSFSVGFVASTVFYVLSVVTSCASVFMDQTRAA